VRWGQPCSHPGVLLRFQAGLTPHDIIYPNIQVSVIIHLIFFSQLLYLRSAPSIWCDSGVFDFISVLDAGGAPQSAQVRSRL
jgi:hypothetical protein